MRGVSGRVALGDTAQFHTGCPDCPLGGATFFTNRCFCLARTCGPCRLHAGRPRRMHRRQRPRVRTGHHTTRCLPLPSVDAGSTRPWGARPLPRERDRSRARPNSLLRTSVHRLARPPAGRGLLRLRHWGVGRLPRDNGMSARGRHEREHGRTPDHGIEPVQTHFAARQPTAPSGLSFGKALGSREQAAGGEGEKQLAQTPHAPQGTLCGSAL